MPKETPAQLAAEIQSSLAILEAMLPSEIDGPSVSAGSKLPFKALWFRAASCWRMAQLGRSACASFEAKKLASAVLLTRACMETCAAVWYLSDILERVIDTRVMGEIDRRLMNLLVGTRIDSDQAFPRAENVFKFIDIVNKTIPGFRTQYERLSEFAHPNHSGTVLLFSTVDENTGVGRFGENMRAEQQVVTVGLANLASALEIFLVSCASVEGSIPELVRLCQENTQLGQPSEEK